MGTMFLGAVLMSMYAKPAKSVADADLEPVWRGAWAAWAKSHADEQAAATAGGATSAEATSAGTPETVPSVTAPQSRRLAAGVHHG